MCGDCKFQFEELEVVCPLINLEISEWSQNHLLNAFAFLVYFNQRVPGQISVIQPSALDVVDAPLHQHTSCE